MKIGSLPYTDYVEHAPDSGTIHINHENCPAGADTRQRLYITNAGNSILAYCHNCGQGGRYFKNGKPRTIHELREKLYDAGVVVDSGGIATAAEIETQTDWVEMPSDCIYNPAHFPAQAAAWLYRYRLTDDQIIRNGIAYSPQMGRVLLPVYSGGQVALYQARHVGKGTGPKYLTVASKIKTSYWKDTHPGSARIVIVEDMISAIRVSEHENAVALLGTSLREGTKNLIARNYGHAVIWMDPDHAGRNAALTITRELSPYIMVTRITSAVQPKEMSSDEINDALNGSGSTASATHP